MQVITIFNEKGGVGKTTIAGTIGGGLAMRGHRVLMIDADGQGDLTVNHNLPKSAGFYKFMKWADRHAPDYVATKDLVMRVPPDSCPGQLYLVAGNNDTWGIAGSTNLQSLVKAMATRFAMLEKLMDYIIIDTQPSATMLHDAIGLMTDWFICPTDPEALSAYGGLKATVEHIQHIRDQSLARGRDKARVMGIVPNKYRSATGLHSHVVGKLREEYGDLLVWDPIPLRIAIAESQLLQKTLMHDHPETEANDHLWALVDNVEAMTMEGAQDDE